MESTEYQAAIEQHHQWCGRGDFQVSIGAWHDVDVESFSAIARNRHQRLIERLGESN